MSVGRRDQPVGGRVTTEEEICIARPEMRKSWIWARRNWLRADGDRLFDAPVRIAVKVYDLLLDDYRLGDRTLKSA